jgi:hypothetical protein
MSEYPYPFFNEKGKLICQICGKPFLVISPRHLAKHNIKYQDYTKRFPKAPLSSQEFIARGKYGKHKDFFKDGELGPEQLVDETDPEIEELDVEKFIKNQKPLTPMESMKARILDHLKLYFANIRKDYLISQYGVDNRLKFEFITDFCDPILKVVIQFPDTFWHNQEAAIDPNKNVKLQQYGWKVIEIPSKNPSFDLIDQNIDET